MIPDDLLQERRWCWSGLAQTTPFGGCRFRATLDLPRDFDDLHLHLHLATPFVLASRLVHSLFQMSILKLFKVDAEGSVTRLRREWCVAFSRLFSPF